MICLNVPEVGARLAGGACAAAAVESASTMAMNIASLVFIGFFAKEGYQTPAVKEPLPERASSGKVSPKSRSTPNPRSTYGRYETRWQGLLDAGNARQGDGPIEVCGGLPRGRDAV